MHDKPVSLMLAAITWWSTRAACGHSLLVFRKPCPGDRAASAGSERSRISVIEVRPRPVVAQKKAVSVGLRCLCDGDRCFND